VKPRRPRRVPTAPSALLSAALRAQSEGVFVAERAGAGLGGVRVVFANEAFCAMIGYTARELAGQAHGFLHVERTDNEKLFRWLRAPARERGPVWGGEGYLVRKDGTTIYAAWSMSQVAGPGGRLTHIVATYRDMTEKRHLQEALVHAQRLDAVGRLAGGVAHDFNNLLSVINGYCEILAAQVADNPQALREVTEIHNAGRKAAGLTQQLLAFGRRQPMNPRVINFNDLVRDNAEIMRRLLSDSGRLEVELDDELGNVRADPAQFLQALLNLVLNARDSLREGGRVLVSTAMHEIRPGTNRRLTDTPPGRYATLVVSDNGTGMDAETQTHLFEPFFTTKPEGKGTGLGLALVYGVVQQSGGFITLKSTLLVGTTFVILLPVVTEPVDDSTRPVGVKPLPATRGSESVLLVEEDDVVRKMVAGILTADGYRVLAASNPAEALNLARAAPRPSQLLIASLGLPEAQKLARALHQNRPTLRVLNVSPGEPTPLSWLPPKHQASLPKPFALSEILKAARKLLDL